MRRIEQRVAAGSCLNLSQGRRDSLVAYRVFFVYTKIATTMITVVRDQISQTTKQ